MSCEEFVRSYCDYNGISSARRADLLRALRSFEELTHVSISDATPDATRSWMEQLVGIGMKPSTIENKYRKVLLMFLRWMWERESFDGNTMLRIRAVKPPRGSNPAPRPYAKEQVRELYAAIDLAYPRLTDRQIKRFQKAPNYSPAVYKHSMRLQLRAIVALAFQCGLRRLEIFRASVDDISDLNEYVAVRGKSPDHTQPKNRAVPHTPASRRQVAQWLEWRRILWHAFPDAPPIAEQPSPWLVLSRHAREDARFPSHPLRAMRWGRFQRLLEPRYVPPGYELHRLRHTCATFWLRAGMNVAHVQHLLGHANIQTTMLYVQVAARDVSEAVERLGGDFPDLS